MTENKEPVAIKKFVRDIVDNAQWCRLLNTLQCNKEGCVEHSIYVNVDEWRNMLFWDIYEYLTNSEWGETIKERMEKMHNPSNNMQEKK